MGAGAQPDPVRASAGPVAPAPLPARTVRLSRQRRADRGGSDRLDLPPLSRGHSPSPAPGHLVQASVVPRTRSRRGPGSARERPAARREGAARRPREVGGRTAVISPRPRCRRGLSEMAVPAGGRPAGTVVCSNGGLQVGVEELLGLRRVNAVLQVRPGAPGAEGPGVERDQGVAMEERSA